MQTGVSARNLQGFLLIESPETPKDGLLGKVDKLHCRAVDCPKLQPVKMMRCWSYWDEGRQIQIRGYFCCDDCALKTMMPNILDWA